MSLMEQLRSGTDSTLMQVVLGLLIISFVFWYSVPQGDTAQTIVEVNGEPIRDTEFNRALRSASSRFDRALNDDERARLAEQVRAQLIEDAVVLQEAERMGLTVSDREIARRILQIQAFHNKEGRFEEERYRRSLRAMGYTRSGFEDELRKDILREKLRTLVFTGATVSEPVIREFYVDQSTRIDLRYVRVRPQDFVADVEVTDDDLATFLEEDAPRIEARYNLDKARLYEIPDEVTLSVIRVPADEGADDGAAAARLEALRAEIEAGADFAALAREHSTDPTAEQGGSLGAVALRSLSQDVRLAVADLEPGQVSKVVEGDGDARLFLVQDKTPGRVIPLEEVQADIARTLIAEDRAPALAAAFAEELHAEWTESGALPAERLAERGIEPATTGLVPTVPDGSPFSPPAQMIEQAARADVGAVLPQVYPAGETLWVGALADREDPDMAEYEEQKDLIREQVLMQRRSEFFTAWKDGLVAQATIR